MLNWVLSPVDYCLEWCEGGSDTEEQEVARLNW